MTSNRGNLSSAKQLAALVQDYPDHGFVIDFKEAESIFKNVRKNNGNEKKMGWYLREIIKSPTINATITRIYPTEVKDDRINQSGAIEGIREDQRKTRQRNSGNSGEVIQTRSREESTV